MSPSIVRVGNGPKFFLTCRIPYLKFYILTIAKERFKPKVNANSGKKDLTEFIISIPDDYGRFTNA